MSNTKEKEVPHSTESEELEGGAYEVIRKRLRENGRRLGEAVEKINSARLAAFGNLQTKVLSSDRILTENNCVARDLVAIGDHLIFGYDVFVGLRKHYSIADTFTIFKVNGDRLEPSGQTLIDDPGFKKDYEDLLNFYKNTRFKTFHKTQSSLLMVFRTGEERDDLKVFKWSIDNDNKLTYEHNRADREYLRPPQHEFEWTQTTRDQHVYGRHPHVSIEDKLFVECVGGDFTIKVENNTSSGKGVFSEPVDHKDQTLDDADIQYALAGPIVILRVLPFQEEQYRYYVFNSNTNTAERIDDLGRAAILLPDNDGIIFPSGYYLASGEIKYFDLESDDMAFRQLIQSDNGEDYLYIFFDPKIGEYNLLKYNIIAKSVETPLRTHGFALFEDGRLLLVKATNTPQKSHGIQWWQTPFAEAHLTDTSLNESPLQKLGNRNVVSAVADLRQIVKMTQEENIYLGLYNEIVRRIGIAGDQYFWLGEEFAHSAEKFLKDVETTAKSAVDEFEKVVQIRGETAQKLAEVTESVNKAIDEIKTGSFAKVEDFVETMSSLNRLLGQTVSLKEMRYIDLAKVQKLESKIEAYFNDLRKSCIGFLLTENSLSPFFDKINDLETRIGKMERVKEFDQIADAVQNFQTHMNLLTDLVNGLDAEDAGDAASIIEKVSELVGRSNQLKSTYTIARKKLLKNELADEFHAQFKLLGQSVPGYLDQAETPEKCDELSAKVMLTLEELETRFTEFPEFIERLSEKREEVYAAFNNRKVQLEEHIQRRTQALINSAERVLGGIQKRADQITDLVEINAYFASDPMVRKVRSIVEDLQESGANVQAEEIAGKLKTLQQQSSRQLKDRTELYAEGANVIKFGEFSFSVSRQELELSIVYKNELPYYHLNGTSYFQPLESQEFGDFKPLWDQILPSETATIPRAMNLAYLLLTNAGIDFSLEDNDVKDQVLTYMNSRYDEGYEKGIHDDDALKIVRNMLPVLRSSPGSRYHPDAKALAHLFLQHGEFEPELHRVVEKCLSFGRISRISQVDQYNDEYVGDLRTTLIRFVEDQKLDSKWNRTDDALMMQAGRYLFDWFKNEPDARVIQSATEVQTVVRAFFEFLDNKKSRASFKSSIELLDNDPGGQMDIVRDWLDASGAYTRDRTDFLLECQEAILDQMQEDPLKRKPHDAKIELSIENMRSTHEKIVDQTFAITVFDFFTCMERHINYELKRFKDFQKLKHRLNEVHAAKLKLHEFKPRILSSFVRNKLINNVYLPKVGANLAKQMGEYGNQKRTDLMGMLLLISPPGYGKTTLMEYIANRLGLIFMKINGPALGHNVMSLDPAEAPNATSRGEVEKLNLAFEMGNNVMVYLDDIQHCNPEFLQKFISLCDGQRKIEGVWNGEPKTYDLRGRRIAVVMAGNPYTETGEKFRIPDMLANRADIYNLGDMLSGASDDFELSYVENALTSHPVLAKLSSKSQKDVYEMVKIARQGHMEGAEFGSHYSQQEITECTELLRRFLLVQKYVLEVNQMYIQSAAQDDRYRTEPKFLLQGSYRNMNKIVGNLEAVMTEEEVLNVLIDHYRFEAQILTSGAEFNFLRFREILNILTEQEKSRLEQIRSDFQRGQRLGNSKDDPMGQIVGQIDDFNGRFSQLIDIIRSK